MSRWLLLIRYCACVLVQVLLSNYSIYCITLFSDSTNSNTKTLSMGGGRFPSSFTRRISILSVVTGVKQSQGLADQTVPPLLVFATPLPTTTISPPPPPNPPGCRLSRSPVQSRVQSSPVQFRIQIIFTTTVKHYFLPFPISPTDLLFC